MPDGPGRFTQDFSCPALLRSPLGFLSLRVRGYHPLWPGGPAGSTRDILATTRSYNPEPAETGTVWANPRSLATTGGIIRLFSFPAGTEMFQFPAYALRNQAECRGFTPAGCPIRRPADQRPFAPTRGLSQLTTSFIACESHGIPRAPFLSFPARALGAAAFRAACTSRNSLPRKGKRGNAACLILDSLLSYLRSFTLVSVCQRSPRRSSAAHVENNGFEPLTPCLQSRCSSQLS